MPKHQALRASLLGIAAVLGEISVLRIVDPLKTAGRTVLLQCSV